MQLPLVSDVFFGAWVMWLLVLFWCLVAGLEGGGAGVWRLLVWFTSCGFWFRFRCRWFEARFAAFPVLLMQVFVIPSLVPFWLWVGFLPSHFLALPFGSLCILFLFFLIYIWFFYSQPNGRTIMDCLSLNTGRPHVLVMIADNECQ